VIRQQTNWQWSSSPIRSSSSDHVVKHPEAKDEARREVVGESHGNPHSGVSDLAREIERDRDETFDSFHLRYRPWCPVINESYAEFVPVTSSGRKTSILRDSIPVAAISAEKHDHFVTPMIKKDTKYYESTAETEWIIQVIEARLPVLEFLTGLEVLVPARYKFHESFQEALSGILLEASHLIVLSTWGLDRSESWHDEMVSLGPIPVVLITAGPLIPADEDFAGGPPTRVSPPFSLRELASILVDTLSPATIRL